MTYGEYSNLKDLSEDLYILDKFISDMTNILGENLISYKSYYCEETYQIWLCVELPNKNVIEVSSHNNPRDLLLFLDNEVDFKDVMSNTQRYGEDMDIYIGL